MYTPAKLSFRSYMPKQLEIGMWFLNRKNVNINGKTFSYLQIHDLKEVPRDKESFLEINGAPVEMYIVAQMMNPDSREIILAEPHEIGWLDEGDWSEDLTEINVDIVNYLLEEWNGDVAIETDAKTEDIIIYENKCTIRTLDSVPTEEEEEPWDDVDDYSWRE
jgi:hypothetical protein